jgi:hypothetical protein
MSSGRAPWEILVHVAVHDGGMWRDFLRFRDHLPVRIPRTRAATRS